MGVRYHINPELGPLACSTTSEKCFYGPDAPHYEDATEAAILWSGELNEKYGTFAVAKSSNTRVNKADFALSLNSLTFSEIQEYADTSAAHLAVIDEIIQDRAGETQHIRKNLSRIHPRNGAPGSACDLETYEELIRDYESYRNNTAELVEAYIESKFYASKVLRVSPNKIGHAIRIDTSPIQPGQPFVTSSDVGVLAMSDFVNKAHTNGHVMSALTNSLKNVETNIGSRRLNAAPANFASSPSEKRMSVWVKRIQDDYVADNPDCTVTQPSVDYVREDRAWQRVGAKALITKNGNTEPEGILEVLTSSNKSDWKAGVPVGHRAKSLYELDATGLKYADVVVLINDSETVKHRVFADEDVTSGVKIDEYLNNRVTPWLNSL